MILNFINEDAFTMNMEECSSREAIDTFQSTNTVTNLRGNQQFEAAKTLFKETRRHGSEMGTLLDFVVSVWKMLIRYYRQTWHSSHHTNPIVTIKYSRNSWNRLRHPS